MAVPIVPIRLGDVVRLKKPHACGENQWEITKLGMDIGLRCVGCGRKVRLERYEFDRRFRGFISRVGERGDAQDEFAGADGRGGRTEEAGEGPFGDEAAEGGAG